ncbi:MAG: hypothetical protein ACYTDW_20305 [Planctomycetota bacterium]
MNLVKWFRKNRTKVMAVVVVVILFGFIGGTAFLQFISKRSTGLHKTVAYFSDNRKITNNDIMLAREELKILEQSGVNYLLINIGDPLFRTPDFRALLLGELLFGDRRTSPELVNVIKRTIREHNYRISDKQISDIYRVPREIYWHCLKKEAQLAGMRVSNEDTRRMLVDAIPKIQQFNRATYLQLIGSVIKRLGIPEEKILTTFGKLLAIMRYAEASCSGEDITSSQIKQTMSWEWETIDVNFVKFDSAVFAETQSEPNQEEITGHFNKYQKFFAGTVSEENPYGFGYKLTDRVQLEYIACRLDDISAIVTPPTQEEAEEYYRKKREQFTEQVLSDPNDPNSPLTERFKGYSEVASVILKGLLQIKINSKAKSVMNEAKALTEVGLQDIDTEPGDLSAEQFKQRAGDYEAAAEELSKKYEIEVYSGQTGLLGAADMQLEDYLGKLYMSSYGENFVGLTRIVFAVDELGLSELGPFDVQKPRMYENIGPARDVLGQIIAIVRVIDAEKATEPESINQTFSASKSRFEKTDEQTNKGEPNLPPEEDLEKEDVYSVKEKVTEDLKRLAAMDATKKKAEEFIGLVAKDGWESTIENFNELYGPQDRKDESDPNVPRDPNAIKAFDEPFKLENSTKLQRISRETIGRLTVRSEGNPGAPLFVNEAQKWLSVNEAKIEGQFIDRLYSLVPQDSNTVDAVPLIMEFKPDMSYYVIKEIRIRRVVREEYEQMKPIQVYREEYIQFQSLAAVHYGPENILQRTNFRWVGEMKQPTDANAPTESEEAS